MRAEVAGSVDVLVAGGAEHDGIVEDRSIVRAEGTVGPPDRRAHTPLATAARVGIGPMRFAWNRATADDSIQEPSGTPQPTTELAAVQVQLSDDGTRVGWIDTRGQRTSDWLNAMPEVPIHGLAPVDEAAGEPPNAMTSPAESIERDRIVWVVPPPLPPNRHLRLHRRRVLVHLELDDHEVSGQIHVRPGAEAIDQVLRGTRDLVPLTEVQVTSRDGSGEGAALPVLIVNRTHVRRVVEDTPHASAAVPDPVGSTPVDPNDPRLAFLAGIVEPAHAAGDTPPPPEAIVSEGSEPTGIELLHQALALLLEAGLIDVVEFQSIRARIPSPPTG